MRLRRQQLRGEAENQVPWSLLDLKKKISILKYFKTNTFIRSGSQRVDSMARNMFLYKELMGKTLYTYRGWERIFSLV